MPSAYPKIGVMIGDPAGIGPEVCVKAIVSTDIASLCRPILIGQMEAVQRAASVCRVKREFRSITSPDEVTDQAFTGVIDPGDLATSDYQIGKPSAAAGRAVVNWLRIGQQFGQSGSIDGLVLAPVDKDSLRLGGMINIVDDLQPLGTYMLRLSGRLRVVPIAEHIPLRDVAASVKTELVLHVIEMLDHHLRRWGIDKPRIAVAGLNPHAMYEEDRDQIAPAVVQAQAKGFAVTGPVSPDAVFRQNMEGKYDAVVTMYHDQGQIAVKTAAFSGACTVYLGLPYLMLNVPHGSAFDIAGRGIAQHQSLLSGLRTAATLASGKGLLYPANRIGEAPLA